MVSSLSRRLVVAASSAALVGGVVGFVPLLGSASADACPTWTDPAGDSGAILPVGTDPTGLSSDDDLDIVSTSFSPDATGGLVVQVKVKALSASGPANTPGDEFVVNVSAGGTALKTTLKRDALESTSSATLAGAASATGKVAYDVKASTVTGTFTADQVKTALGKPLAGIKLSTFQTLAYGYTETPAGPGVGFPETDQSDAPAALTYTDSGSGCGVTSGSNGTGTTPTPTPTGTPAPSNVGPDGLFLQPRKGCVQYKDPTGDADPTGTGADNEDSLDITKLNLKSSADGLQLFVGIVDPGAGLSLPTWTGADYAVAFTINGKTVTLTAPGAGPATATVGTTANTDIKATVKADEANKNLVFTVPLDGLSKAVGTTVAKGTQITGPAITTSATAGPLGDQKADTAAGTTAAEKTYTYGDNTCFLPAPGTIALNADPKGEYGHVTEVFATLDDADGSPVQQSVVSAVLTGGRTITAQTDDNGIADIKLPLTMAAGTKTLTVTWKGDNVVGPAKAAQAFVVVPEKTVLKLVAIRGGAEAILLDDTKHPVVGRYVTFTIGTAHKSVKTSSKGIALVTGLKPGTLVKATFLAVKGYYLGTPTYKVSSR